MKYMGSKNRIAKFILPIMLEAARAENISTWVEPFVGGGNMIDKVPASFTRIGIDFNPHTIAALIAVRDYADLGLLPDSCTEEKYQQIRGGAPDPVNSWLRFIASFGGKFDAGYARSNISSRIKVAPEKRFVGEGKRNAEKQSPFLQGVQFIHGSYADYSHLENCLIYCDPPYYGTTAYKTGAFNHPAFWQWVRNMSDKNSVFVSEYVAPHDFDVLWEGQVKTHFANNNEAGAFAATEKLFKYNDLL